MRAKLAPRRVRDLRPPEFKQPKTTTTEQEATSRDTKAWPFDLARAHGGKIVRSSKGRAGIKGYRKLERRLNPEPKYTMVCGFKVYC